MALPLQPVQFGQYLSDLARGDLGRSLSTGLPVAEEIMRRLPASLELTLAGLLLAGDGEVFLAALSSWC